MYPNEPNQPGGQPPYTPPAQPVQPQQNTQGSYDVVPPIAAGVNGGHSGHNPYEFIVNPNTTVRKGGLFGGNRFLQQLAVIIGGAIVLMIAAAIIINAVIPNTSGTASLTGIIQQQQEIVRVAAIGSTKSVSQTTLNFATTVQTSVATSQSKTTAYAAEHGLKLNKKVLAQGQKAATDTALANATATNTFDATFIQTMSAQLKTYQSSLKTAYADTSRQELKTLLQQDYDTATLLLKQAGQ